MQIETTLMHCDITHGTDNTARRSRTLKAKTNKSNASFAAKSSYCDHIRHPQPCQEKNIPAAFFNARWQVNSKERKWERGLLCE